MVPKCVCIHCNSNIRDPRYYITHLNNHLKMGETNPKIAEEIDKINQKEILYKFPCNGCKKVFTNPYNLKYHQEKVCRLKIGDQESLAFIKYIRSIKDIQILHDLIGEIHQRAVLLNPEEDLANLGKNSESSITLTGFNKEDTSSVKPYYKELKISLMKLCKTENPDLFAEILKKLFTYLFCSPQYTCNYNLYVTNIKYSYPFYKYENGWKKNGTIDDLIKIYYDLIIFLKDIVNMIFKTINAIEVKTIINGLHTHYHQNKGKNNCFGRKMARIFHEVLYDHRENIKEVWLRTS